MQKQVDELKAELAESRKRQREADDGIKVKLEKVEAALGERGQGAQAGEEGRVQGSRGRGQSERALALKLQCTSLNACVHL
jgi:hypothetical protein